jgi:hypothetical protein
MSVFTNPASRSADQARAYTDAILGLLGDRDPMEVLQRTVAAAGSTVAGMTPQELRAREAPDKWACNQVLQHLADSDLVWAFRLRMVVAQDRPPLGGYNQDAWAERLGYADADPDRALRVFATLREANVGLLRTLTPGDLQRVGVHAERGEESIAHMMRMYAGHDLLHLRQLERIREAVTRRGGRGGAPAIDGPAPAGEGSRA